MFSGWRAIPIALFAIVSVLGCAPTKLEPLTASSVDIEPPEEKKLADLPVLQLEEKPKKPRPEKLYTLSVRAAPIRDVLLSFSRESRVNIIVDPDVGGKVTIDLKDVTLEQAMDALLTPLSLEYHMQSGFIRVSRPKMMTRLFHLNYIITARAGSRGLASNIAGTSTTAGSDVTAGSSGTTTSVSGGITGSNVGGADIQNIFVELEYGLAALGLHSQGQLFREAEIPGGGGTATTTSQQPSTSQQQQVEQPVRGYFSINRQAGIILINAYPDILAKAAELIEAVEGTIQRQVLIQAKIVEVTLDDDNNYGINWDLVFDLRANGTGMTGIAQGAVAARSMVTGRKFVRDIENFGDFTQFTIKSGDMQFVLDALNQQGDVNVISSPQISTLNNQTAIIKASTERTFFNTETTFLETSSGVFTPQTSIDRDTRDIGVTLDVTPQISHEGVITMNIHPAVTELLGIDEFSIENTVSATAPVLTIREADTVVRVSDGETIVIGGLMKDSKKVTEQKFPLFWRVPGIGKMFTSKKEEIDKTDLVIFLTPTVLIGERVEDYSVEEMGRLEMARGLH